MNGSRFTGPLAAAALFLAGMPAMASQPASNASPRIPATARQSSSAQQSMKPLPAELGGLRLSEEQKSKIEQIRVSYRAMMNTVVKAPNMGSDQKRAFLEGYQRMENREIFEVLTADQRTELNKKLHAEQAGRRPVPRPSREAQPADAAPTAAPGTNPQ